MARGEVEVEDGVEEMKRWKTMVVGEADVVMLMLMAGVEEAVIASSAVADDVLAIVDLVRCAEAPCSHSCSSHSPQSSSSRKWRWR